MHCDSSCVVAHSHQLSRHPLQPLAMSFAMCSTTLSWVVVSAEVDLRLRFRLRRYSSRCGRRQQNRRQTPPSAPERVVEVAPPMRAQPATGARARVSLGAADSTEIRAPERPTGLAAGSSSCVESALMEARSWRCEAASPYLAGSGVRTCQADGARRVLPAGRGAEVDERAVDRDQLVDVRGARRTCLGAPPRIEMTSDVAELPVTLLESQ